MFNNTTIIISAIVFALIATYSLYNVITALKRGYISYGGNSPSTSQRRTYTRKEQPVLFWIGIAIFSVPVLIIGFLALAFSGVF